MDPKHRIGCFYRFSGKFEKDMSVKHSRTGKTIDYQDHKKYLGREKVVDDAYPGDVIGFK